MAVSSKKAGAHVHSAIEVAQLEEWARVAQVEEWAWGARKPQVVGGGRGVQNKC